MNENDKISMFAEMMETTVSAARKIAKPWIIALIVTNILWAIVAFSLIWFAYMTPLDGEQVQSFNENKQEQTFSYGAAHSE